MPQLPAPVRAWLEKLATQTQLPEGAADDLARALGSHFAEAGEVSERRIGRYTVLEKLGEGGAGVVYKVFDEQLERVVALKLIHQHRVVNEHALQRFINEARTTAQLQHPSVVPVHEIGRLRDGRVYFTMQQVVGRTLTEALRQLHSDAPRAPSQRDLIDVLQRVAEAITYAHAQDIVHRDLKPDNVMLGEYGEVYVLDWGIARLLGGPERPEDGPEGDGIAPLSRRLTGFGQAMGSPDYMAPEQAAGAALPIGHTADIYALGGMLFEILVGRPPVLGLADVEQNLASAKEGGAIPKGLEDLLRRTLTPDPRVRYTDTRGVLKGLRQWLAEQAQWVQSRRLLREARELQEDAEALESVAEQSSQRARAAIAGIPAWAGESAYLGAWSMEDEAAALRKRAASLQEERVHLLRLALAAAPEHVSVQEALAAHYHEEHSIAEAHGDETTRARAEVMLRRFDLGRFRSYLAGTGALTLATDAPGATAILRRFETQHRRRVLAESAQPLPLPLAGQPLAQGSYMLLLDAPGRVPVRYPVHITREYSWDGIAPGEQAATPLRLPLEGAISDEECVVLAGWTTIGGDAEAAGCSLRPLRYWIPSFSILRYPVTNSDYLRYLRALWTTQPSAVRNALPQALRGGQLVLGLGGPAVLPGSEQLPVVGVTYAQARSYARWRAEADGLPWRLPGEWEWEKAARSVDGRRFPWGDHFTPARCNTRRSQKSGPTIAPVGAFPMDRSPLGVCDTAGGVREWCSSPYDEPPPSGSHIAPPGRQDPQQELTLRGGSWRSTRQDCLLARRVPAEADQLAADIGFRLARSLP